MPSEFSSVNQVSQSSFTANHKVYDAVRPGYTDEAVAFAHGLKPADKVLEVAAGTGKFTAGLLKHVKPENLTIAEPSGGMIESFSKNFPHIKAVQAASDAMPFEDSSFEIIYVAQAFHWFANRASLEEFRRVLKPHGVLVLIWNYEDMDNMDPKGWQYRTTKLVRAYSDSVPQYHQMEWEKAFPANKDLFSLSGDKRFTSTVEVPSPEFYWKYWQSRSYITALPEEEQEKLREKVLSIVNESTAGDGATKLEALRGTHIVWATSTK